MEICQKSHQRFRFPKFRRHIIVAQNSWKINIKCRHSWIASVLQDQSYICKAVQGIPNECKSCELFPSLIDGMEFKRRIRTAMVRLLLFGIFSMLRFNGWFENALRRATGYIHPTYLQDSMTCHRCFNSLRWQKTRRHRLANKDTNESTPHHRFGGGNNLRRGEFRCLRIHCRQTDKMITASNRTEPPTTIWSFATQWSIELFLLTSATYSLMSSVYLRRMGLSTIPIYKLFTSFALLKHHRWRQL